MTGKSARSRPLVEDDRDPFFRLSCCSYCYPLASAYQFNSTNSLPPATLALSYLIDAFAPSTLPTHRKRHIIRAITLLALTASIVRAETALLLAGVILALFIKESSAKTRYVYTRAAIVTTAVAGLAGTVLSIAVDSYFWSTWLLQNRATEHLVTVPGLRGTIERALRGVGFGTRWIWPELWGVLFNVVEGKSELWGVRTFPLEQWDSADARCRLRRGIPTSFPSSRNCCSPRYRWRWLFRSWIPRPDGR